MLKKILAFISLMISTLIGFLIGKITWNTPPWMNYLYRQAKLHPKFFWKSLLSCILLLAAVMYGYHWYQSMPQPERVMAQITPPKLTPNDKILIPDHLTIDFGVISNGQFQQRSVAPLKLVGKTVIDDITITPALAGQWKWETDSHLVFTPSNDWIAGQTYTITFAKKFFTAKTKMEKWHYSFSTLPFDGVISEFKFYQDPTHPELRQAIATVNFSYPVDTDSLANKVSLQFQAFKNEKRAFNAQSFKYTISYDEHKRTAYIRSEPLPLPPVERYLELTLAKGIQPLTGSGMTPDAMNAILLIPDSGSYFKITNVATSIVRDQQDKPNQLLTIETSLGVTEAELNKSLHVYLLPKDYPATSAEEAKPNYEWKDPGEVTPEILATATPLNLHAIPSDREYATLHSYQYQAATPAFIYIKIDKGTSAFGHFVLANNYATVLKAPSYPQEITFLHKGALLALGTEEKLSVLVRGLSAVKFNFARVLPDDVNHLVSQTSGDFSNPYFIDPNFNQDNISQISSEIQRFNANDPAKAQYTALDLGKYLSMNKQGNHPLGLFLLQARGWDANKNIPLDTQTSRLVLMTDLGLIVKDNSDDTHDVFVQSITNGTPISAANIAILGKNGLPLFSRVTDRQGHANFPSLKDFANEREPTVYIVRHGSDVSFIPYNRSDRQLNYSRFDVGGVNTNTQNQAALTAYIFSDRGIYRPGDMAHIAMIVKQPYVLPQAAGLPLEATVTDPRGVTIKDEKMTLNESGYLTFDFQTTATAPTGLYQINLYIVKDHHPSSQIGSMTMNVAEFLPDRLRITAHLSNEENQGWISPSQLKAKIALWNLYGAPAADHRVSAKLLLKPQAVTFKNFPDYTFIDPLLDPKAPPKVFTDTLADQHTNAQGQAEFDLKLDRFTKATYQLSVFVQGFEAEGGRSVATQTSALVSPLAYLVGYKPDGDLAYIKQNAIRHIHFIAINPQLKQQALMHLQLKTYSQHPITTLVKKPDGTYQYESVMQTALIHSQNYALAEQGTDFNLSTQTIGDFLITVEDEAGTELSRLKYSVVGSSQQPLPKNAELNVKLNKTEFAPGEDIEMQITAPYTGAGLITIERDKVYAFQWFKTNTTSSIQKIHIPNDFQGGGYVNIAFVRDLNSPEIFMSPLSYSVIPFSLSHKNHDIQVDLSTPDLARPGDVFTMTYKTTRPSKIIVFAVDEGILQVSQYPTPDPLKFFFEKRALDVNTLQIVDQILPKFIASRELSAIGGDTGVAALRQNLNPFKRKTEAPVVYWSGIIDADTMPRQLTYSIPDYFNGTLRVMAVAVAPTAVGAAAKSTEVRGQFVINPNVPTFVAPGDTFEVTTNVANNVEGSGSDATISVELKTSPALQVIGSATQTVVIPEKEERSVHFKLRALSQLGSADLEFFARYKQSSSKINSTLSIRPAMPYFTSILSGYTTDISKTFLLDRSLYPDYRHVEAAASSSPLILVIGLQRYLNEYPYGCTEQLVSKAFPLIVMVNQPWFINQTETINNKIQQLIQLLSQRQRANGSFSYWPEVGTTNSNDFASIYAMHFLTEAKAQGYIIPNDVFSAGIGFLKDFAGRSTTDLNQIRLRAYAIYLLTRNEIVTTNYLTNLQLFLDQHPDIDWKHDITSAYIAATYQLLKSDTDANKIIHYYTPLAGQAISTTDFYNQNIADAQYLYLVARHFPEFLVKLNHQIVMSLVSALNNDTMSTVLSSYTSLALATYGQFYPTSDKITLSINEMTADGKQQALTTSNGLYQHVDIDPDVQKIIFKDSAHQPYFYQLSQAGFDQTLPKKEMKQNIEVYRDYRNQNDEPLHDVKLGDEITVHIRARSTDNMDHDNIALVDLLPGGFEVVRDSINAQNMDYVDIREDRVIFFGSLYPDSKEIVYRIKATNIGNYTVPPMFAAAMYNPLIKSVGLADNIKVNDTQ